MSHRDFVANIQLRPCGHPECPIACAGDPDGGAGDGGAAPRPRYRMGPIGPTPPELTVRQREIVLLLVQDRSLKEIGNAIGITEKMAGTHKANIMAKLGIRGIAALTRLALRWRWIEPVDDDRPLTADAEVRISNGRAG